MVKQHLKYKSATTRMGLHKHKKHVLPTPTGHIVEMNARLKYSHKEEAACCDNQAIQRCNKEIMLFLTIRSKRREKVNPIFAFCFGFEKEDSKQCNGSRKTAGNIVTYVNSWPTSTT